MANTATTLKVRGISSGGDKTSPKSIPHEGRQPDKKLKKGRKYKRLRTKSSKSSKFTTSKK